MFTMCTAFEGASESTGEVAGGKVLPRLLWRDSVLSVMSKGHVGAVSGEEEPKKRELNGATAGGNEV